MNARQEIDTDQRQVLYDAQQKKTLSAYGSQGG